MSEHSNPWINYEKRIRRVTDHIHAHLDEELDLDRLAEIACMSAYHWHRIYRAVLGETPAMTVKRLRLHRAAGDLVTTTRPIADIARQCGYPNLQSFTRIFRADYGIPPAAWRKQGKHVAPLQPKPNGDTVMYDVSIRKLSDKSAVGIDHAGSYMEINKAFTTLFSQLAGADRLGDVREMFGLYLDDPDTVAVEQLRSAACVVLASATTVPAGLKSFHTAGGDYAVLTHKGPYANLQLAYRWLYSTWLKGAGRELRDAPLFEVYVNNPREVPASELLTEICVPLK
ncbi:AraC family transcriptional regulator [Rhizobium sp. KVB221]|uniref:AraC family transcriptional regulator n=1 Tax=Rhizobium setariae TaxID=2801340 RepID=A0A936YJC1_9HYPH|nr:AraC family transcriptional regulator [Rhizobium setariae]MBL0371384.1 AraC family transcriptional regulator [Rhizobium setariae]